MSSATWSSGWVDGDRAAAIVGCLAAPLTAIEIHGWNSVAAARPSWLALVMVRNGQILVATLLGIGALRSADCVVDD